MSKDISIYVSHRIDQDSAVIDNPLYVSVRCGAVHDKRKGITMLGDDTGDNISEKQMSYNELTVQYWAWKNDHESDYIGLCHYRRFLCFADASRLNVVRNARKHLVAYAIDEYNIARFGLEDERQMRSLIETSDVVVAEPQKMGKIGTPHGRKRTAYEHWVAHDRSLIFKKDLDKMLDILDRDYPDFARDTRRYLSGEFFLGFNCFVLRRDLFEKLCAIEFDVLAKLETQVNLTNYSQAQSRIFGFMGEIIFSTYIYRLEKSGKYHVRHVPLLFFNYTDKITGIMPVKKPNVVPVLFLHQHRNVFLFATALQSILSHTESS